MLVPWDDEANGPYLGYIGRYHKPEVFKENFEFETVLHLEWLAWTYQSRVHWQDANGVFYNMFLTDFEKMLLNGKTLADRRVSGRWTWIKRGQQFGLRDVEAPK